MTPLFRRDRGGYRFVAVASDRSDGDVHPKRTDASELALREHAVAGRRWAMIDQFHGTDTVLAPEVGKNPAADRWPLCGSGDILVSPGGPVGVWAADCAPIALFGNDGTVVVVHAGWRGLAAGVIDVALDALRSRGIEVSGAVLGPVIHPCCYEFGKRDLAAVAAGVHARPDMLAGGTSTGRSALDVPEAVAAALYHGGSGGGAPVELDVVGPCTGCDERWFSHRQRQDTGRHAVVAWSEPLRPTEQTSVESAATSDSVHQ